MTPRRLLGRLAGSLALLAVLLAAAEGALRLAGAGRDPLRFEFAGLTRPAAGPDGADGDAARTRGAQPEAARFRAHPRRVYELAPGFRLSGTHLGRDALDGWPYRGRPSEPAPPSLLRVAVVGDSCVYGTSLDAADMLGSRLADALADRGWTPDRVAVLSLGVPGYSTEQLDLLLEEALANLALDAVVLYPAAWNDQAPALAQPDAALLAAFTDPGPLEWIARRTRLGGAIAGALRGAAGHGAADDELPPRVPAGDVEANVARMLARCTEARAAALAIAPAHPADTAARHPRTRQDATAVLRAARAAGVPGLDGQALLDAAAVPPGERFVDFVHPAPRSAAAFAAAAAEALLPGLDAAAGRRGLPPRGEASGTHHADGGAAGAPLVIVEVTPREAPVLGDVPLRVRLSGWTADEPLPAVIVGGAPLLALRILGEDTVEGLLIANAAGTHDLVVQTAHGCAWRAGALVRVEPAITLEPEAPGRAARLRIALRPGDRAQLFAGTAPRAAPHWSPRGAFRLDEAARPLAEIVHAGADGLASVELPPGLSGRFLVQALVLPAGAASGESDGSRWTPVMAIEPGPVRSR